MKTDFIPVYRNFIQNIFIQGDCSWPEGLSESFVSDFLNQTRSDGIQLLLFEKAAQSASWVHWPETVRLTFAAAAQNDAIVDTLRQQDFVELHQNLSQEDIHPILLKGAALSLTHYASSYLRPRSDTDFLISPDARGRLNTLMPRLGYRSETPTGREYGNYQISFSRNTGTGIKVIYDVHWKLCNPELFASVLSYEEIYREALDIALFGQTVKVISPAHALLHACVHMSAHHAHEQKLIWLYDIHLLCNQTKQEALKEIYDLAAAAKVRQVCGHSLRLTKDFFGTEISDALLEKLMDSQWREPSARFLKMAPSVFSVFAANFSALPWGRKLRLLFQNIFPSPHFMMEKYQVRGKALLPFLYFWRLLRGIPKILKPLRKNA